MKQSLFIMLIPAAVMSSFAYAEQNPTEIFTMQAPSQQDHFIPGAMVEEKVGEAEQASSVLPFWGDEARAKGYKLPPPIGININYMNIRQNIVVESIGFSGLSAGGEAISPELFNIDVGHTRQWNKTETLKLDAWLLPFMNIYGIVGYTKGASNSKISVSAFGQSIPELQDLEFVLKFKGVTYGAGTTFVGGYENWYGSLDMNYTQTRFNVLDGSIDAFTLSPRVGYRFNLPASSTLHLGPTNLSVWVGSMYQNVQQEFRGSISDLNMPSALTGLITMFNADDEGRFKVKQHIKSPWNMLIGTRYEITDNFNITTEFGFAQRNSFFLAAEYRL